MSDSLDCAQQRVKRPFVVGKPAELVLADEFLDVEVAPQFGYELILHKAHVGVEVFVGGDVFVAVCVDFPFSQVGQFDREDEKPEIQFPCLVEAL